MNDDGRAIDLSMRLFGAPALSFRVAQRLAARLWLPFVVRTETMMCYK